MRPSNISSSLIQDGISERIQNFSKFSINIPLSFLIDPGFRERATDDFSPPANLPHYCNP